MLPNTTLPLASLSEFDMKHYHYIFTGSGLSALMTVYEMVLSGKFNDKSILLLDENQKKSNDRTWCFWEKDTGEWDDLVYKSWKKILFESNSFSPFNMFVASKEVTDDYCTWLFSILENVEKQIKISTNPYQERVLGFMSERLLNVYVEHNQLKVKYLPVHFINNKIKSKSLLIQKVLNCNNNVIFWFRKRLSRKKITNTNSLLNKYIFTFNYNTLIV